jgi:SAM-dependent methyltransferase
MQQSMIDCTNPETDACAQWVSAEGTRVYEFGCGDRLTVPWATGVDQYREGDATAWAFACKASVIADCFKPMPQFEDDTADTIIARHLLEHAVDLVAVFREWRRILKPGGRLIIACPNEELVDGVPMDVTHLHGVTPDSVRNLAEATGYRQIAYTPNCGNNLSFVGVYEKVSAA